MRHQHCCMPSVKHILCAATLSLAVALPAAAQEFKLGVVTFLSGQAAGPFGIPAKNAAELTVDAINAGTLPAPYNTKGIAGMPVKMTRRRRERRTVEAGHRVPQPRRARQGRRGHRLCLVGRLPGDRAGGRRAQEAHDPLRLRRAARVRGEGCTSTCSVPARTARSDNVAAARYVADTVKNVKKFNGINQNYAWGQDSWDDFTKSMAKLKPGTEVGTSQMPKLGAGTYSSEISALLTNDAQLVHSSFWGADLESFVQQGKARGLVREAIAGAHRRRAVDVPTGRIDPRRRDHRGAGAVRRVRAR